MTSKAARCRARSCRSTRATTGPTTNSSGRAAISWPRRAWSTSVSRARPRSSAEVAQLAARPARRGSRSTRAGRWPAGCATAWWPPACGGPIPPTPARTPPSLASSSVQWSCRCDAQHLADRRPPRDRGRPGDLDQVGGPGQRRRPARGLQGVDGQVLDERRGRRLRPRRPRADRPALSGPAAAPAAPLTIAVTFVVERNHPRDRPVQRAERPREPHVDLRGQATWPSSAANRIDRVSTPPTTPARARWPTRSSPSPDGGPQVDDRQASATLDVGPVDRIRPVGSSAFGPASVHLLAAAGRPWCSSPPGDARATLATACHPGPLRLGRAGPARGRFGYGERNPFRVFALPDGPSGSPCLGVFPRRGGEVGAGQRSEPAAAPDARSVDYADRACSDFWRACTRPATSTTVSIQTWCLAPLNDAVEGGGQGGLGAGLG